MIKHNGIYQEAMDSSAGGFRRGLSNSPIVNAARDRFLRSRGIDPKDLNFRTRIKASADAAKARKAKRA